MQKLIYPTKIMNISQTYNGIYSHINSSTGYPKSYPIDEVGSSGVAAYFYAPCDLIVKRIYGVNNNGTNTIWLESLEKVKLANNKESFITIMVVHPNDDTLRKFKVNQVYKQYDKMFLRGDDGNATGKHLHIEISTSKFSDLKNNGWIKNSKGAWVISNKSLKPESAFYVDEKFTKIKSNGGLNFKKLDDNTNNNSMYYPEYKGLSKSLVDALKSIKVDSSFDNRQKIAKKNGISNYSGTSIQNNKLMSLLKKGKLFK